MYCSLKSWLDIPIIIKVFDKRTGTGAKLFNGSLETNCYISAEDKVVTNDEGVEVVSNTQVYLDGNINVHTMDCLILNGVEKSIVSIVVHYRKGVPDLKVVYI